MASRPSQNSRVFENLIGYEGFLNILRYYVDLNCFIITKDPGTGTEGWLAANYHRRDASLFDFEKKYGQKFNWDKLTDPDYEKKHRKDEPLLLETLGFCDIFMPIRRGKTRFGTILSGAFAKEEVTYPLLKMSWNQLTGQTATPENPEFRQFVRVMLDTPVLEGPVLSAYREAMELFANVLVHGNISHAPRRLHELSTKIFSKHFPHSYFMEWALGLPTRQATPLWNTEVPKMDWIQTDIGIRRVPTTVLTVIPLSTHGKKRDPIEEMFRIYRFQRKSFRIAQTYPQTVGGKLENYGALFITSSDPSKSRPQRRNQIEELAQRIHTFAQEELEGPVLVGVGETVTPGDTLFESYQQAVLALHLGRRSGQEVVFYKPVRVEASEGILEITGLLGELKHRIETSSLSGMEKVLDEFLKQVLTLSMHDPDGIRLHLQYALIQMREMIRTQGDLNERDGDQLHQSLVLSLEKAGTTQEMIFAFKDALEKLLRIMQGSGAQKAAFSMEKVRDYLDSHFGEPLRAVKLAQFAEVSVATLSRHFKKTMGMGLENYLQNLRLEEAKRLLKTGSLPVSQITKTCGFKSGSYFARLFRQKTGLSPQQFRDRSQRS
jgi:AraC-like DNA-binding protein